MSKGANEAHTVKGVSYQHAGQPRDMQNDCGDANMAELTGTSQLSAM